MPFDHVPVVVDHLVAPAEADVIGSDAAVAGGDQRGDDARVQVTPRGLTVHQQHHRPIGGAFVEIVHAQPVPLEIVRREGEPGEMGEVVVGGSDGVHTDRILS